MREAFSQHFATDPDRRTKLWESCLFVFDTNVLTGIYRRSEEAREAQYKLMGELGDRLWIPHRVIYEFLDNRAKIVHDQAQLYASSIASLQDMLTNFEVATRHPFLPAEVYGEFKAVSDKVLHELESSRLFHDGRITNDDVKLKLAEIFEGKVGPAFSEEKLIAIVKDGEARYAQNIPPGFEDRGKHKGSSITEEIRKRYGDLIIWNQIIEKAKQEQRPIILVTGDQKPDWWAEQSGKKLGPHPGLIEEFKAVSGQDFYLYSYHGFLDFANQYLGQKTSESVIEEVRESAMLDAELSEGLAQDEEDGVEETYDISQSLLGGHGQGYGSGFDIVDTPEYRVLSDEEKRLKHKIKFCEREIRVNKNVLGALQRGAKAPVGALQRVAHSIDRLTDKLSVYIDELKYVQQKMFNLRSESAH